MGPRPIAVRRCAAQCPAEHADRVADAAWDERRSDSQPLETSTARDRLRARVPSAIRARSGHRDSPRQDPCPDGRFVTGVAPSMQARRHRCLTVFAISLLKIYRNTLSLLLLGSCRFFPSCSIYAQEAIEKYGPFLGGKLTARRILRCHPFSDFGLDPVP